MKNIFILPNRLLIDVITKLQETSEKCLIVVDKNKKLLGTITDGDIRRAILKRAKLNHEIKKYFRKKCYFIESEKFKNIDSSNLFENSLIDVIPIINKKKVVIDYISRKQKKNILQKRFRDIEVVIMAGGFGTRLLPYTSILPKPLLYYKGKTLLENIIEKFNNFGLNNFKISLFYKSELIKSFFKELKPKYKLSFLQEKKPLGTAGILKNLEQHKKTYIVTNCDSLFNIDINDLLSYHSSRKYDLTVVVCVKSQKIPYGVCKIVNNTLRNIIEKPEQEYLANSGLYVANAKIFKHINKKNKFSFIDLIQVLLKKKFKIGVYPISSKDWQDFGQNLDEKNLLL